MAAILVFTISLLRGLPLTALVKMNKIMLGTGILGRNLLRGGSGQIFAPPIDVAVRHRKSIDLRNPRPRHVEFRLMQELCKPILPPRLVDPAKECRAPKIPREGGQISLNPYDQFRLTEVEAIFRDHTMIIMVQRLSMTARDFFNLKLRLYRKGLALKVYPNNLYLKFMEENPKYSNLATLFVAESFCVAGAAEQAGDLVKLMKKDPHCTILGGVIKDRLYNRAGITEFANLPDITVLHAQLSSILNNSLAQTSNILQSQQQQLTQSLEQYVKQSSE